MLICRHNRAGRCENKRKDYTFWHQFDEKQNNVSDCLGAGVTMQRLQPGKQWCASVRHLLAEVLVCKRAQDGREDAAAAFIGHVSHGQQVEVAQQAVGDGVTPAPWGPHGRHKLGVNDLLEGAWWPPFIPSLQHCTCSFCSVLPVLSTQLVRLFQCITPSFCLCNTHIHTTCLVVSNAGAKHGNTFSGR